MAKILLDYLFPITLIEPTPAASTAFLKQVAVIAKPKAGQESNVGILYECTSMAQVSELTDNTNAQQLFNAGMSRVYVILADDLDLSQYLLAAHGELWTVLISDDFLDADVTSSQAELVKGQLTFTAVQAGKPGNDISIAFITGGTAGAEVVTVVGNAISVSMEGGTSTAQQLADAIEASAAASALITVSIASGGAATAQAAFALDNLEGGDGLDVGTFDGVVGYASSSQPFAKAFGVPPKRSGFLRSSLNGAKNMFFAFGKLLSNISAWRNQQYIVMPFDDQVDELGEANSLFDDKVSFVIKDTEFGNRLALFVAGGKAIAAPYIAKNLSIDIQSQALTWITANQPDYTLTNAALLESNIQSKIIDQKYVDTGLIEAGVIEIKLIQDNFVANGYIDIAEPKALWRVFGEMKQTL